MISCESTNKVMSYSVSMIPIIKMTICTVCNAIFMYKTIFISLVAERICFNVYGGLLSF